jgi:hypothetical protein
MLMASSARPLPADPLISGGDDAVDALEELAATAEEGDAESDAAEQG